jgi:hypothetical protein
MAGCRTIPVEVGEHYLHGGWTQELMTLADFLDNHVKPKIRTDSTTAGPKIRPATATTTRTAAAVAITAGDGKGRVIGEVGTFMSDDRRSQRKRENLGGKNSDMSTSSSSGGIGSNIGGIGVSGVGTCGDTPSSDSDRKTGYLAQHALFEQIPALLRDIDLPDYCALSQDSDTTGGGGEEGGVKAVNAWLGPAGTVSPLHTDPHHNLLSQAVGRKYVRLYAPSAAPALYPHPEPSKMSNSSRVDLRLPPAQLAADGFPLFAAAPFLDCVLGAGDMLYIPPKWFHYVQSLTSSFSVSFWWR